MIKIERDMEEKRFKKAVRVYLARKKFMLRIFLHQMVKIVWCKFLRQKSKFKLSWLLIVTNFKQNMLQTCRTLTEKHQNYIKFSLSFICPTIISSYGPLRLLREFFYYRLESLTFIIKLTKWGQKMTHWVDNMR